MKQIIQSGLKGVILALLTLFWAPEPGAGSAVLAAFMPDKQKRVNIVGGIFPSVLMEHPGVPGQTQGGKPVILRNHNISRLHPAYKGKIHTVRAFVENEGFRPGSVNLMGGIAKDGAGNVVCIAKGNDNVHHRAAVRVNEKLQKQSLLFLDYTMIAAG